MRTDRVVDAFSGLGTPPIARVPVLARAPFDPPIGGVDEVVTSEGGSFSRRPLYLQVRDALAELITRGAWKPGSPVPTEGDLAREFGVSPGTMRKALELMASERVIVRRQGRGSFVADPTARASSLGHLYGQDGERLGGQVQVVEVSAGVATAAERLRLRLSGSDVYRIRRVVRRKQLTCMVADAVVPADLFQDRGILRLTVPGCWNGGLPIAIRRKSITAPH